MSVTPLNTTVTTNKLDKAHVAPNKAKIETSTKIDCPPEEAKLPHKTESHANIQHKQSNSNVKHNVKLFDEKHEVHEGHGTFGKAKEEAIVKACEKTATHAAEHVAAKTAAKSIEKAAGQAILTAGMETAEHHAVRHAPKLVNTTSKVLAKGLAKIEQNATGKAVTGVFKAVGHTMEKKVGTVMEVAVKAGNKVTSNGFSKIALNITEKVGAKAAGRMAAFVPVAGAAVGAVITKIDYDDYKAKMKDPNVSKTSKVLAGATVGLDVVSTGASAVAAGAAGTVVGLPVAAVAEGVSWVATGLSIVTSAGSEITRNKNHH